MIQLKAAHCREVIFDVNGEAYALAGISGYLRVHHLYSGRTDPLRANVVRGQLTAYGGALFAGSVVSVRQDFGGDRRQVMAVAHARGYGRHTREVVWIDLEMTPRVTLGRSCNRLPIGGQTLLDLGNSRGPDKLPASFGYVRAFELFDEPREEGWHEFEVVVCDPYVMVSRIPNHLQDSPSALALFHRDDWRARVVYKAPKAHPFQWFKRLSRGFAQPIEPGRWMYYPASWTDPVEIRMPLDDHLFDVRGDVFLSGRDRTSGVRMGRIGRPVREIRQYDFHGPRTPSYGGALAPDGLTGYVWSGKELVQFDIDI